jgi:hypothetical protein
MRLSARRDTDGAPSALAVPWRGNNALILLRPVVIGLDYFSRWWRGGPYQDRSRAMVGSGGGGMGLAERQNWRHGHTGHRQRWRAMVSNVRSLLVAVGWWRWCGRNGDANNGGAGGAGTTTTCRHYTSGAYVAGSYAFGGGGGGQRSHGGTVALAAAVRGRHRNNGTANTGGGGGPADGVSGNAGQGGSAES